MSIKQALVLAATAALALSSLTATVGASEWSHYGMHGGWAGMALGPLMMIVWVAVALAVVLLVLRLFGIGARSAKGEEVLAAPSGEAALDILKRRFASGEIDARTFDSMKTRLSKE